jgi:hypothetical protein
MAETPNNNNTPDSGSGSICTICQDVLAPHERQTLECGHAFHATCIIPALRRRTACPSCRDDRFNTDDTLSENHMGMTYMIGDSFPTETEMVRLLREASDHWTIEQTSQAGRLLRDCQRLETDFRRAAQKVGQTLHRVLGSTQMRTTIIDQENAASLWIGSCEELDSLVNMHAPSVTRDETSTRYQHGLRRDALNALPSTRQFTWPNDTQVILEPCITEIRTHHTSMQ